MKLEEAKEILIKEAKRRLKIISKLDYGVRHYYKDEEESMTDLIELLEYSGI